MSAEPAVQPIAPWLHIIGIGADGEGGLSPAARAALASADVVVGGARHHRLTETVVAERIMWPSPFSALVAEISAMRGRRVAVLVTGCPLWHSAGAELAQAVPGPERVVHPHPSAYQLAAARMGWPLAETVPLTVHGRAVEAILPAVQPGARLLVLAHDGTTPARIGALLAERGYGPSQLTALAEMGGAGEARIEGSAAGWTQEVPPFHTLAVEVAAAPGAVLAPSSPGLDDSLFAHDGTMTKSEVRAITLAKLMPMPGARLWDIGAGCGSVAVEWMRAAPRARAIALEPRADRRAIAAANAARLGTPGLDIRAGSAPEGLADLPPPDAVFFGGGLSEAAAELALAALRPLGRFVANAVTLETEARLLALQSRHGGALTRISVARADIIGGRTGWRPAMPVTQWSLLKR